MLGCSETLRLFPFTQLVQVLDYYEGLLRATIGELRLLPEPPVQFL